MSKQITFGKYNGSTVNEVAIADPSYAGWAAQNMKSAEWRKAFADALALRRCHSLSIHIGNHFGQFLLDTFP